VAFTSERPIVFLIVPWILWMAIRFGPRLAAPACVVVVVIGTYLAAHGHGPFGLFADQPVAEIQFFHAAVALAALVGGAHSVRAWEEQRLLERTLEALPELVALVNRRGRPVAIWGPPELRNTVTALLPGTPTGTGGELDHVGFDTRDAEIVSTEDGKALEVRTGRVTADRHLLRFRDVTAEVQLGQLEKSLRERVDQAQSDTQLLISRELHDGPVQTLTAARLQLEIAQRSHTQDTHLARSIEMIGDAIQSLRTTIDDLSPPAPADGELCEALQRVADDFYKGTDIAVQIHDRLQRPVKGSTAEAAYQIGKEALVNARLHAGATMVTIDLRQANEALVIDVSDNGIGFDPHQPRRAGHLGLTLMTERAASGGGTLQLVSSAAGGTTVRAVLPLAT
jgi:signal transduction histidine kinase